MAWVAFESIRFGRIDAREEEIIHFPGLPGFPEARRFVFRGHDCGVGFGWMLCVDDPALAFVVADPAQFVHGYAPEIPQRAVRGLGAKRTTELEVVAIATVLADAAHLNLGAPVVVNRKTQRGLQVLLENGGDSHRAVFDFRTVGESVASDPGGGLSAADPPVPRSDSLR